MTNVQFNVYEYDNLQGAEYPKDADCQMLEDVLARLREERDDLLDLLGSKDYEISILTEKFDVMQKDQVEILRDNAALRVKNTALASKLLRTETCMIGDTGVIDLEPCPFCGSPVIMAQETHWSVSAFPRYTFHIKCNGCTGVFYECKTFCPEDVLTVYEKWNHRLGCTPLSEALLETN